MGDALGFGGGEVAGFGAVGGEVVEFPGLVVGADEFPVALANGLIAFVFEAEDFVVGLGVGAGEGGKEAAAFAGMLAAGGIEAGG